MNNENNNVKVLNLSIFLIDNKMGVTCSANKKFFVDADLLQKHLVNFTDEVHSMLVKNNFIE